MLASRKKLQRTFRAKCSHPGVALRCWDWSCYASHRGFRLKSAMARFWPRKAARTGFASEGISVEDMSEVDATNNKE